MKTSKKGSSWISCPRLQQLVLPPLTSLSKARNRRELSLIFSVFFFRYFTLKNSNVATAMIEFFKKNYRKNNSPEILNIILSGSLKRHLLIIIFSAGSCLTFLHAQGVYWDDHHYCQTGEMENECGGCHHLPAPYADQYAKSLYATTTLWWKVHKRAIRKRTRVPQNEIAVELNGQLDNSILIKTHTVVASGYLASVNDDLSFMAYPALTVRLELTDKKGNLLKSKRFRTPGAPYSLDCNGLPFGRYSIKVFDESDGSLITAYKFWVWGNPPAYGW